MLNVGLRVSLGEEKGFSRGHVRARRGIKGVKRVGICSSSIENMKGFDKNIIGHSGDVGRITIGTLDMIGISIVGCLNKIGGKWRIGRKLLRWWISVQRVWLSTVIVDLWIA